MVNKKTPLWTDVIQLLLQFHHHLCFFFSIFISCSGNICIYVVFILVYTAALYTEYLLSFTGCIFIN